MCYYKCAVRNCDGMEVHCSGSKAGADLLQPFRGQCPPEQVGFLLGGRGMGEGMIGWSRCCRMGRGAVQI